MAEKQKADETSEARVGGNPNSELGFQCLLVEKIVLPFPWKPDHSGCCGQAVAAIAHLASVNAWTTMIRVLFASPKESSVIG